MTSALAAAGAVRRSLPGRSVATAAALVWAGGVATTLVSAENMSGMGRIPMAGGWTLSTMWTGLCGGSEAAAAASFLAMWIAMMVAMMTPALAPALERRAGENPSRAALAAAGYFAVWTALGLAIHLIGKLVAAGLIAAPEIARGFPLAGALVVAGAGALQFSAWKARRLARCRETIGAADGAGGAFRDGLRLGRDCCASCAGPTAVLLVLGLMDLAAMALVSLAVTAERLSPDGPRAARIVGAVAIAAGLFLAGRATGLA